MASRRKPENELVFLQEDIGTISMVAKLHSLKVCYDLLTQEKAKQDEEHRLVHEDKEDL